MTIMKKKGCIKLFRIEIELEKQLNDTEFRLWLLYRRLADWDKRHSGFATVKESLREIQRLYLASWSIGKISMGTSGLIRKGLLERTPEKRIRVKNLWIYQERVHIAEQLLQRIEQGVQPTEQDVQIIKQRDPTELERQMRKLAYDKRFPK